MQRYGLILKHFRRPQGYIAMSDKAWHAAVKDALKFGCDWLEIMMVYNPMTAAAVEEMADRLEKAEKERRSL